MLPPTVGLDDVGPPLGSKNVDTQGSVMMVGHALVSNDYPWNEEPGGRWLLWL